MGIALNFNRARGDLDSDEFMFFLTGGVGLENKNPNPDKTWLTEKSWDEVCRMSDLPAFKGFRENFSTNVDEWRKFYDDRTPQDAEIPAPWQTKLNEFQKLIVLRCIRPDKVLLSFCIVLFKSDPPLLKTCHFV